MKEKELILDLLKNGGFATVTAEQISDIVFADHQSTTTDPKFVKENQKTALLGTRFVLKEMVQEGVLESVPDTEPQEYKLK